MLNGNISEMILDENLKDNVNCVSKEMEWLKEWISNRLESYFKETDSIERPLAPKLNEGTSLYASFLLDNELEEIDRLIIVAALASYFKPQIFDRFLIKNKSLNKRFTEFGGKIDENKSIFIPTLETIAFIFYGDDFESRFKLQNIFDHEHVFTKLGVLSLNDDQTRSSFLTNTFTLNDEFIQLFTLGRKYKPNYSTNFPATLLTTSLDWEDLILSNNTAEEVQIVNTWIESKAEIDLNFSLQKKINKGYKCLFYGPPGTGKTLTTSLIGKKNNKDIYRIDLSEVVSKYIGETEKNLAKIFDTAENRDWILFFDEAESLFSKRTGVQDSKDKYANQQTAYMLQRIENYNGLIILATNLKPNIDLAFSRRIQSVINFPIPNALEREKLWIKAIENLASLPAKFIREISSSYEISGGVIKNVIQYAWLISKKSKADISENHILAGIRRELNKDGKSFQS